MADSITSMDIAQARKVAEKVAKSTDDLSTALNTLFTNLKAKDGCWGRDDTGKQFDDQYVKNRNDYQKNAEDLVTQLHQNATNLRGLPDHFDGVDSANSYNVR